jgi:hypothetical protein
MRRREAMVMQMGEGLVPMLEKVQRTCFASVYSPKDHSVIEIDKSLLSPSGRSIQ